MREHDIAIVGSGTALPEQFLAVPGLLGGLALVVLGLGTWAGRWYAPLLRCLDGIHPSWLGPALLCLGVGVGLAGGAALPWPAQVRVELLDWAAVALVLAVPSALAGVLVREVDSGPGVPRRRRRAPGRLRRALRFVITHQSPAGGPVWPGQEPREPARPSQEQQPC
ncbi:MAG TPA: hypothetical protein VH141_18945 [Pseudonocardia sp.]|jgi:hypothetical protein|nr:hypothetical protein [Pseudonocardia sp.]